MSTFFGIEEVQGYCAQEGFEYRKLTGRLLAKLKNPACRCGWDKWG